MIKIINSEAEKMPAKFYSEWPSASRLLEKIMELEKEPTRAAIDYIKGEIGRMI